MKREFISPEELKIKLDKILGLSDFLEMTREIKELKTQYPFITGEDPYKDIYWSTIKKWHIKLKNLEKTDPEIPEKVDAIVGHTEAPGSYPKTKLKDIVDTKEEIIKDPEKSKKPLYNNYVSDVTYENLTPNNMKIAKIKTFGLFLEGSEEGGGVQKEVKKIISEMFAFGKNITFSGDQNGEPAFVEFEISKSDFGMTYDQELFMEYSENVLRKRPYHVTLKYSSSKKTGSDDKPTFTIKFKINLKPTSEIKSAKEEMIGWEFEEKPTKVMKSIREEGEKCSWNSSDNILSMTKNAYNKIDDQISNIIRDAGGQKVRIK